MIKGKTKYQNRKYGNVAGAYQESPPPPAWPYTGQPSRHVLACIADWASGEGENILLTPPRLSAYRKIREGCDELLRWWARTGMEDPNA